MKTRIDQLLVERGLCESRAKARAAVEAGRVTADGRLVAKASELVDDGAVLAAEPAHPWVGRGGLKLDHALSIWPVRVEGRVVVDVGASTGGFTEVCLARGARRVFAVDVGRGQLHARLRDDPRVANLEGVDARSLDATLIDEAPDLVVCDASFIGLAKVLPAALKLAGPGADLICLVKPQFEAGPADVGRGGIVRDEAVRLRALEQVSAWLVGEGWAVLATADSPITGGDGNREFLLHGRKA
ncbi:MAG: TlyA family RNA methyltransferase [Proteobacteria bacterium]|nr:TlyA family RNA methyltransferase [Pseudomonadota bacterium]